jgi:hypothetical protein
METGRRESTVNRKERRKAKAMNRKPLARPGIPISQGIVRLRPDGPDGPVSFYWFASERLNASPTDEDVELHGPFDTEAEANADAKIAIVGEDCVVKKEGMWDPAWNKPQ